jgi:hypothetical protein
MESGAGQASWHLGFPDCADAASRLRSADVGGQQWKQSLGFAGNQILPERSLPFTGAAMVPALAE